VQAAGNISVYEMGKVHREKRKGFFSFLVLIQEKGGGAAVCARKV
jgi:hypothetical protein